MLEPARFAGKIRLSLFYLTLVAAIGTWLRYMFVSPVQFPVFENLLHAHSHFAILGWLYNALYIAIVYLYVKDPTKQKKYNILFWVTQISIGGMLVSFTLQGYATYSIAFSTLHILCSYVFIYFVLKDISSIKNETVSLKFIYGGLFFLFLSSLGPWGLVAVVFTGLPDPDVYKQIIYFYLHFQYNGWFVFALIGLWLRYYETQGIIFNKDISAMAFQILFYANLGAYVLSLLGFSLPGYVYAIGIIAAFAQLIGARYLYILLFTDEVKAFGSIGGTGQLLFRLSFFALFLKFLFQLISAVPQIGYPAFVIRDITIGYIHLVMIGVMTLGILGWFIVNGMYKAGSAAKAGIYTLIAAFVLSECVLLYHSPAGWFGLSAIPNTAVLLLALSVTMLIGTVLIFVSSLRKSE